MSMWKVNHSTKTAEFVAANNDVWHYRFHTRISTYALHGDAVGTVASQDSTTLTLNIDGRHVDVPRSQCVGLAYWKVVRAKDAAHILADIDPQDTVVAYNDQPAPVHMPASIASHTARQSPKRLKKPSHRTVSIFKHI